MEVTQMIWLPFPPHEAETAPWGLPFTMMFDYPSPEGQTKTKVKQLTGAVNYIVWDCWYPLVFSDIGATLAHESGFFACFPFIICLNTGAGVIFGVWLAQTHTRHYFSFWRERSVVRLWFYVLFCSPTIMIIMIFMLIFIIVLILIILIIILSILLLLLLLLLRIIIILIIVSFDAY